MLSESFNITALLGVLLDASLPALDVLTLLVNVLSVFLSFVALGSSLPASYSSLISLRTLAVANNKLVGSVPPLWDVVAYNLSVLDLSENQLTGASSTSCFAISCCRVCTASETEEHSQARCRLS